MRESFRIRSARLRMVNMVAQARLMNSRSHKNRCREFKSELADTLIAINSHFATRRIGRRVKTP